MTIFMRVIDAVVAETVVILTVSRVLAVRINLAVMV